MDDRAPAGEPQEASAPAAQQPGVTEADVGSPPAASADDVEQVDVHEVAEPPTMGAEPDTPRINASLLDDPEAVADAIRAASGEEVEVVTEDDLQEGSS